MPSVSPEEQKSGRIVTFYSYKGGTGRTMALANVAWILASNGMRVLAADWDLESPGLHRFFAPFLDQSVPDAPGVIDMVRGYEFDAAGSAEEDRLETHIPEHARVEKYVLPLRHWDFPGGGSLEFLSPGRQNRNYLATLSSLDWDGFHETLNGGEFIDAVRADMRRHYDYTLIDSRTGLGDIADVCTVNLPDVLVDCFTLSTQGLDGAEGVARRIAEEFGWRGIRVLPVPMRVDESEKDRVEASRVYAQRLFVNLPTEMTDLQRRAYWNNVEVPYRPYYAYEEVLAAFGDKPGAPGSILSSYERLTGYITDGAVNGLPPMDDALRSSTRAKFDRKLPQESNQVIVEYLPEDQLWAEWITAVLDAGGFMVRDRRLEAAAVADDADSGTRVLAVVSAAYVNWRRALAERGQPRAATRPDSAVYVGGARSTPELAYAAAVSLSGARDEAHAVALLRGQFNIADDNGSLAALLPRYPGKETRVFTARERNAEFTGREKDLRTLREELRGHSAAGLRPVALLGTAGVGKTSEALEYAYRFRNDYDLVAWIDCQRAPQIDVQLRDLGQRVQREFGVVAPDDPTLEERAQWVLGVLSDGVAVPHWLIIYDNAEDIDAVRRYLPSGGGQVLITSQHQGWAKYAARWITVDIFEPEESVQHLRRAVRTLSGPDAVELAAALGNLPAAITMVAAFLGSTLYPVGEYLRKLASAPSSALEIDALRDYPKGVATAWDLALHQLSEQSAAASRLLELFSVMAPNIALSLVYEPPMAELLEPYDPALSEPLVMPRVVLEATRLNLLRLDSTTEEIHVHQIVQLAVRSRMTEDQLAAARADVQRLLYASRSRRDIDNQAAWNRYELLWPHLRPAQVVLSPSSQVRQLIVDRMRYLSNVGDYDRGVAEATEVVDQWTALLERTPDPIANRALRIQLLQVRFNQANILRATSRFEEARAIDEQVLAEQSSLLGESHPHTLSTAGSLAADFRALGRYPEALARDLATYPASVDHYGDNHERTLLAANNLAVSYRLTGQVYEALHLDEDTLRRLAATFGDEHNLTLYSLRNVVRDRLEAGDYAEAAADAGRAYRMCASELGVDSPAALDAQVLLGIALRSTGRAEDAEIVFDEALGRLTARFGDASMPALACRLSRAANLGSLERYAEAEAETLQVLAEYQRRLGAQHPHALVCHVNLASTLRFKLEPDRAIAQITAALHGLERAVGAQHPYTLAASMVYSVLLADMHELDKAEQVEARVADALTQALGSAHPDTLRCQANLLLTRQQRGQDTAAERDQVIAELEHVIGADHPTISTLRAGRRVLRALDPPPY